MQQKRPYLDYLIDSSVQGVKGLFVLSFSDDKARTGHT